MSALVLGGAGFIGTHLLNELLARGQESVSVDIEDPERPVPGVRYLKGDVRKAIDVDGRFDVVYNLAAVHRTPGHSDNEYFETNVAGARNATEFCRRRGVDTIVFTSSISTYGPGEAQKDESSPLRPVSAYGKSKTEAEDIHRQWFDESSKHQLVIVRPAVTFGLGENGNFDRLLRAMRQRRFVYPGRTETIKSCGHVTDLIGTMQWALSLSQRSITYNFAYPERTTIEQIATAIAQIFGVPKPPFCVPLTVMLAASLPFEILESIGLKTGINRARIMKLVESTNVYPKVLVDQGYQFRTDILSGVTLWAESIDKVASA